MMRFLRRTHPTPLTYALGITSVVFFLMSLVEKAF